jgi:hypothetical protein
MATQQPYDNESKLREVGMVVADDLPPEYQAVLKGLTPDERDVLIAVKRRLDEAERVSGKPMGEVFIAP